MLKKAEFLRRCLGIPLFCSITNKLISVNVSSKPDKPEVILHFLLKLLYDISQASVFEDVVETGFLYQTIEEIGSR